MSKTTKPQEAGDHLSNSTQSVCSVYERQFESPVFSHVVFVQASVSEYNGVCLRVNVCVSVCVRVFLSLCESVGACVRV